MVGIGRKHEVVDGELASLAEEVAERALSLRSLKDVRFLKPDPWKLSAFPAQFVEGMGHGALFFEQHHARVQPFFA
jgi:hypothetical protein